MNESQEWTTVIRPKDKLWSINLKELWSYRDLYSLFVNRNIVTQYKQTILGTLWFFIQPILTVIMYMVVFGGIAGIATDGIPQPLFYLAGTCMWQYFSDCLGKTSNTFVTNSGLFGKVYFPRLIVPLSNVTSNLLRFGIQLSLFVIVYIVYAFIGCSAHLNWYALLVPVLILMMAGLSLGFGTLISSMTTLSLVKGKTAMGIDLYTAMRLNPVTPVLETFKYGTLGAGEFIGWGWLAYSFIFMVALLIFGILVFNKTQKSFMDTV